MKKIFDNILGFLCAASLFIACGIQNQDGSCPVLWASILIGFALITGVLWNKLTKPNGVHVPSEVYNDLNKQIEDYAREQEDGYHEHIFDCDNVQVKVAIHNETSRIKFRDDAWGHPKTFTETSWQSNIEILEVTVYDENDNPTDNHDFDEGYIETEYEGGGSWS